MRRQNVCLADSTGGGVNQIPFFPCKLLSEVTPQGPVTRNMELALRKTYDAVPDPKIVIAVGACAINGGPFEGSPEVLNGAGAVLPVGLYIPGCPPYPLTLSDGFLRLLGKIGEGKRGVDSKPSIEYGNR